MNQLQIYLSIILLSTTSIASKTSFNLLAYFNLIETSSKLEIGSVDATNKLRGHVLLTQAR